LEVEDENEEDDDIYADDMIPKQMVDFNTRNRITVRNLRIREDTAKYLLDLKPDGPYYDPKSRAMRDKEPPEKIKK
jgi:pre-mRNA-processing factor SLU7